PEIRRVGSHADVLRCVADCERGRAATFAVARGPRVHTQSFVSVPLGWRGCHRERQASQSRAEKGMPALALEAHMMDLARSNHAVSKILIADDDPCVLRAVAERCARAGFEVETATTGLKTLVKVSQYNPDILIIDVHMPEVDGLSVCAFLQDIARQPAHVMVVTGGSDQEILGICDDIDAVCIHKGNGFWNELDA